MPSAQTDILVIGGGPAGAAAAATVRAHAPARSVTLLDAARSDRPKPGEILPAVAQGLLRQIGVWPAFQDAGFLSNRAVVSAWSDAAPDVMPDERHGVFSAHGSGWQLDRRRFDALLLDGAAAAGVWVHRNRPARAAVRTECGWRVDTDDGAIEARAVIWATGRNWRLARSFGARLSVHDRLVAHLRFFDRSPGANGMTIESRPEGWWYSADLPGDTRVVGCFTDPGGPLRKAAAWYRALAETRCIAPLLPPESCEIASVVAQAGTSRIGQAAGHRWVAAGDTMFAADPLSSRGMVHALRSGILAAYAASDMLDGDKDRARRRYDAIADAAFEGYVPTLRALYAATPWHTPFWHRRAAAAPAARAGMTTVSQSIAMPS